MVANRESRRRSSERRRRILLTLGPSSEADLLWIDSGFIGSVVRFQRAAPSGYRLNSRVLGLGMDSVVVALKAIFRRGPVLATNPWVGMAAKILGREDVAVIGIYASPGSTSFRLMRKVLGDSAVITTVSVEADAWVEAGGKAVSVLYGNTFEYPRHLERDDSVLHIFVGGSSDRDMGILERLEGEIRESREHVLLRVVTGGSPSTWHGQTSRIEHLSYVPAAEFGKLVADSDVVFLPLLPSDRAAGHMVTVGALESGVPVAITSSRGMGGYVNGSSVYELDTEQPLLPQLAERRLAFWHRGDEIRDYWRVNYSRRAFVARVGEAMSSLNASADTRYSEARSTIQDE